MNKKPAARNSWLVYSLRKKEVLRMTYFFTLNYTETASLRPVLPPGREEAGGSDAVALSKAHIRRKVHQKLFFGLDPVFIV